MHMCDQIHLIYTGYKSSKAVLKNYSHQERDVDLQYSKYSVIRHFRYHSYCCPDVSHQRINWLTIKRIMISVQRSNTGFDRTSGFIWSHSMSYSLLYLRTNLFFDTVSSSSLCTLCWCAAKVREETIRQIWFFWEFLWAFNVRTHSQFQWVLHWYPTLSDPHLHPIRR